MMPFTPACNGSDVTPPLTINKDAPSQAKPHMLTVDDPDSLSGVRVRQAVWRSCPDLKELRGNAVLSGAVLMIGDFNKRGYGGSCPASSSRQNFLKLHPHHVILKTETSEETCELAIGSRGCAGRADLVVAES